jgi:hypothetical protein
MKWAGGQLLGYTGRRKIEKKRGGAGLALDNWCKRVFAGLKLFSFSNLFFLILGLNQIQIGFEFERSST